MVVPAAHVRRRNVMELQTTVVGTKVVHLVLARNLMMVELLRRMPRQLPIESPSIAEWQAPELRKVPTLASLAMMLSEIMPPRMILQWRCKRRRTVEAPQAQVPRCLQFLRHQTNLLQGQPNRGQGR